MARAQSLSPTVVAALVVGGSVLGGSWMLQSSLDRTASKLDEINASLAETQTALKEVASARPAAAAAPTKRRGPDPDKRHKIRGAGSPARGPQSAKVKIHAFSDFQ